MSRIWRRRIDLEKQYREERHALVLPLRDKYALLREALMDECGNTEAGHDFQFVSIDADESLTYRCTFCAKTKTNSIRPEPV